MESWRDLSPGRKQNRLNSYLQALLASGLTVLPYDRDAALWHGAQRARGGSSGGRLGVLTQPIAGLRSWHGSG